MSKREIPVHENIDISEFHKLNLRGDLNFNGKIDIKDFAAFSIPCMKMRLYE